MARAFTKGLINWLLRSLLILGKQPRWSKSGFVLPTTVMLLLVVTLTVGAIGFRTFTRTQQTIGERQQRVIYNAATPAIDRAKAKLEFLFDVNRDPRGGVVPPEDTLVHMMLNDGGAGVPKHPSNIDPYTFTDSNPTLSETRIDLNGGGLDNAWKYRADTNGDGTPDATIAYSIIYKAPFNQAELQDTREEVGALNRANKLEIRNTPLSSATQLSSRCRSQSASPTGVPLTNGEGWFRDPVNTTILRKNFQVNVYVLPDNPNGAIATLEFQQDRQATQGFKWAAWFRNDLEVFPGPQFNWNGAMHTEGNFMLSGAFRGYMISSIASCLYTQDASELTAAQVTADPSNDIPAFQGQFLAANLRDNDFNGRPRFDLWNGSNVLPTLNVDMSRGEDSVVPTSNPIAFALDPVRLHTDDVSVNRDPAAANISAMRDPNWTNRAFSQKKRMINQVQATPYVDDTFRADDRWGPKPRWGAERTRVESDDMGTKIIGNAQLTGNDPGTDGDSTNVGLDGYWERRARREGLRLIVGQRLELGDPAGWGGSSDTPLSSNATADQITQDLTNEPLRPWSGGCVGNTRCNEARQRKTLWDNLASVQATAVYHAGYGAGGSLDFPLACIATTVHPGTAGTLDKSGTFENLAFGLPSLAIGTASTRDYSNPAQPLIVSDFFRGRGTNGWEYEVPKLEQFTNSNSALRKALKNLALFAGDPDGGAPSFRPPDDRFTHPFPVMSMWGDFSMLRRVLKELETSGDYNALSPADKTTLHTAGCTLSMLAYNIDYLEKLPKVGVPGEANTLTARLGESEATKLLGKPGLVLTPNPNPGPARTSANADASQGLRGYIRLIDAAISNRNAANTADILDNDRSLDPVVPIAIRNLLIPEMRKMAWDPNASNNPETYVRLMERWRDTLAAGTERDNLTKAIYLAQLLITREQVARDRTFGFQGQYGDQGTPEISVAPLGECQAWRDRPGGSDELYRLCSTRPRYPILYSLFPARLPNDPAIVATATTPDAGYSIFRSHGDLDSERRPGNQQLYVRDSIDTRLGSRTYAYISSINGGSQYQVVKPEEMVALPRKFQSLGGPEAWKLPTATADAGTTPNSNRDNLIKICNPTDTEPCSLAQNLNGRAPARSADRVRIPFKDSALYNGRELMSVRALNLDLGLMRTSATPAGNFWLPQSGIVYAFREDAVSEAHIVRPRQGAWATCTSAAALQDNQICKMLTASSYEDNLDPPRSPIGITPKPVDFYPDPDRRPHGFRLRNGASLGRAGDNGIGLSFITDNPAYVQGNFNLHQTVGSVDTPADSQLEEFLERLALDFTNFYTRDVLDETKFSKKDADQWRPSEVLADAVTPLSNNFCDGSIEDSFLSPPDMSARYGCSTTGNRTSYRNQPSLTTAFSDRNGVRWMRSNVVDSLWAAQVTGSNKPIQGESPIFIHPNGNPMKFDGEYRGDYESLEGGRDLNEAVDGTQMNMIMVSGVVPSRLGQSYGGLHNFPRFLENWANRRLFLSGAFLQLNFSAYATAPFDQENWQITDPVPSPGAGDNEWIRYYSPPNRVWGYDVGLQYAPAGPVARRFRFSQPTRSEFYSEPAASDPYIRNLCRSISTNCS
jgi:hypothetical protein